jgi:hypothetical protein
MAVWILIGIASVLTLAILAALTVVVVLNRVGQEVSELLDLEPWASGPLMREVSFPTEHAEEHLEEHVAGRESRRH